MVPRYSRAPSTTPCSPQMQAQGGSRFWFCSSPLTHRHPSSPSLSSALPPPHPNPPLPLCPHPSSLPLIHPTPPLFPPPSAAARPSPSPAAGAAVAHVAATTHVRSLESLLLAASPPPSSSSFTQSSLSCCWCCHSPSLTLCYAS